MDIKAILAKVAKGETLTDEEKAALTEFDPDKAVNSAAAAARKKAEAEKKAAEDKLAELQGQLDAAGSEGKSELEKLQQQVAKLTKSLADKDAAIAKAEGAQKKLVRDTKLGRILAGIKLVPGVDDDLARMALERVLSDVGDDDLDNETTVKPLLAQFAAKNKALILAEGGGGAGTGTKDGAGGGGAGAFTVDQVKGMSPDEFLKNKDKIWAADAKGELK